MRRTLRAARARPADALCLAVTCAVTVVGATCVVAFPAAGDAHAVMLVALLGIGVAGSLASATIVVGAVRAKSDEIRLATVRGYTRMRMWRWQLAEPLLAAVVGALVGCVLAAGVVWSLEATGRSRVDSLALVAVALLGAMVLCVLTTAACIGFASAKPLAKSASRRPVWIAAAECAAVAACGWLLVSAAATEHGDASVTVALTPLAAALATVVVCGWLARAVGALGISLFRRTTGLGRYLTVRRLRRTSTLSVAFACIAGAVVLAVFGMTARQASAQWRDDVAAISTGGVDVYESPSTATATFLATRAADPDGRWLMAIEAAPTSIDAEKYNGFADLTRWERVVGTSWSGSGAGEAIAHTFRDDTWKPVLIGDGEVQADLDGELHRSGGDRAYLNLSMLRSDGEIVSTGMPIPDRGGYLRGRVRGCSDGCVLRKLEFATDAGAPIDLTGRIVVRKLTVDGDPVVDRWTPDAGRTWSPDLAASAAPRQPVEVRGTAAGLEIRFAAHGLTSAAAVVPSSAHLVRRVVAAGTTRIPDRAIGLDPATAPSKLVARDAYLPLIGSHGYLGNLPDVVLDSYDEPAGSRVRVFARADTPPSVLAALSEHGIDTGQATNADQVSEDLADSEVGRGALAWSVLAAVVAHLSATVAIQSVTLGRRRTRLDDAGLRSSYVSSGALATATRYEVGVLSVLGIGVGVLVALVTWWCTRKALVLAVPGPFEPSVDVSTRPGAVVLIAVSALILSAGGVLLARRRDRFAARPALLRREGDR